jgi:superfamily II DNA or RNA helicase
MKLERTTTGLIIHNPDTIVKRKVLQYFSLVNPIREFFIYSGNDTSKPPIFGLEHDVIYISSGFLSINDPLISSLPRPSVIQPMTPQHITLEMNRQPRSPLQEDCIRMLTNPNNNGGKTTVELKPGTGKTFIATYAISKIQLKPLIVAPTSLLKNQWCEEFEGVGVPRSDIATDIYDAPNRKVCVVTISSIENELRKDWKGLMNVVSKSGFGIKVVDEAHLHLKGILKFDAICNIKYNWYLSATLGRSDVLEDNILNRALSDAQRFVGNAKYEEYQKQYVNVYFQDIYYYPSNRLCAEHFKYGSKGLIKATYYNMLMDYHHGIPFLNNLIYMMKVAKKNMTYDAKVLLLVPLLSIIDKVKEVIQSDPFFANYSVSGVDGSMSLATRRQAMESDFILSTTLSMGTGVDVKNLGAVVNFDQFSSPIIVEQIYGRLRDRGKETWYYDITDHVRQARMFKTWGDKRRSLIPYFPGSHDQIKVLPDIKS